MKSNNSLNISFVGHDKEERKELLKSIIQLIFLRFDLFFPFSQSLLSRKSSRNRLCMNFHPFLGCLVLHVVFFCCFVFVSVTVFKKLCVFHKFSFLHFNEKYCFSRLEIDLMKLAVYSLPFYL